ncbi:hypothetical protein BY996DRAFT_8214669, partial [Phakopsora pachyrhizi]
MKDTRNLYKFCQVNLLLHLLFITHVTNFKDMLRISVPGNSKINWGVFFSLSYLMNFLILL